MAAQVRRPGAAYTTELTIAMPQFLVWDEVMLHQIADKFATTTRYIFVCSEYRPRAKMMDSFIPQISS